MKKLCILSNIICVMMMLSCKESITPKEFVQYIKRAESGYVKEFSFHEENWTVTIAPKEYMALNELRSNKPSSPEFEKAVAEFSDMTYVIIKISGTGVQSPIDCESIFLADCGNNEEMKTLICHQIISGMADVQEYMLGFPIALSQCPSSMCFYYKPVGSDLKEKIGCFQKNEMKELPNITTY